MKNPKKGGAQRKSGMPRPGVSEEFKKLDAKMTNSPESVDRVASKICPDLP